MLMDLQRRFLELKLEKQKAIEQLLKARSEGLHGRASEAVIDEQLSLLGYDMKGVGAPKKRRFCGICKLPGHDARKCTLRAEIQAIEKPSPSS